MGIAVAVIPLLEYIARLPTKMESASIIISSSPAAQEASKEPPV
jgi:hypothetical protein